MIATTLFALDVKGKTRVWTISILDYQLIIDYGVMGGSIQTKIEDVEVNKSGRDIYQQLLLEYQSRIAVKRDAGYVDTIEEAIQGRTNIIGMPRPMLAKTFKVADKVDYETAFIQRKYDGNRCLIANVNGTLTAYTRNGKAVNTIDHILEGIQIPRGAILDGELYCHGSSLQTICSWIKRKQSETERLQYHIYDTVSEMPFHIRLSMLRNYDYGNSANIVETLRVKDYEDAQNHFREFREDGYEGAIVRTGSSGYEDGKRSKSLLKMKEWHDSEFEVVNIRESKDGWALLDLKLPNGKTFGASAPGTMQDRMKVLSEAESYIGKYVTVEYANITKDGIPFHPVAKCWRTE